MVKDAITQLFSGPGACKKVGLIDYGCASVTETRTALVNQFNVPQVSFSEEKHK